MFKVNDEDLKEKIGGLFRVHWKCLKKIEQINIQGFMLRKIFKVLDIEKNGCVSSKKFTKFFEQIEIDQNQSNSEGGSLYLWLIMSKAHANFTLTEENFYNTFSQITKISNHQTQIQEFTFQNSLKNGKKDKNYYIAKLKSQSILNYEEISNHIQKNVINIQQIRVKFKQQKYLTIKKVEELLGITENESYCRNFIQFLFAKNEKIQAQSFLSLLFLSNKEKTIQKIDSASFSYIKMVQKQANTIFNAKKIVKKDISTQNKQKKVKSFFNKSYQSQKIKKTQNSIDQIQKSNVQKLRKTFLGRNSEQNFSKQNLLKKNNKNKSFLNNFHERLSVKYGQFSNNGDLKKKYDQNSSQISLKAQFLNQSKTNHSQNVQKKMNILKKIVGKQKM